MSDRLSRRAALLAVGCAGALTLAMAASPAAFAADKVYHIALSNSYIGNQWRVQMVNLTKAYATKYYADKVKLTVVNSGTDVQAQIAAIDDMISQKVDAILVDPASESALNPVLEEAAKQGIVVVDFDHAVTAPSAYKVGVDFVKFGGIMGQWMADTLKGKGDIIMNRGVPGFEGDKAEYKGATDVLAKYPDIHIVAEVYGSVVAAGIHRAPSIKVAEAAKVIENTQRDLNIALMNELSAICHALGLDTADVLALARTKWNFLPFTPGLVGGHCIGVDPYYLTHRAEKAGYHPEVILAGRRINDLVGQRVAQECVRRLLRNGHDFERVTILGLTFKENVPDIRNSKSVDIVRELWSFGLDVQVHDPLAASAHALHEYGITLTDTAALAPADAVVLAVPHESYLAEGWCSIERLLKNGTGLVMDLKAKLDRATKPAGVELWRL